MPPLPGMRIATGPTGMRGWKKASDHAPVRIVLRDQEARDHGSITSG
jgi:hypothetical protein